MTDGTVKKEVVNVKIQGKKYELKGELHNIGDIGIMFIKLDEPIEIDIKISENVNNLKVKVTEVAYFSQTSNCWEIFTIVGYQKSVNGKVPESIRSIIFYSNSDVVSYIQTIGNDVLMVETTNHQIINVIGHPNHKLVFYLDKDIVSFFPDGTLKEARICEDITLNVKFHGKNYNLPFANGEDIFFNDNKELSQTCIDSSPERSAIVYAERLNNLEKQQEKTQHKVKELQDHQEIATRGDWFFVGLCIIISVGLFCFACFHQPLIGDPVSFVRKNSDVNKYVFLFEILKRTPIIVLLWVAFKFLQISFERIKQIGQVEKVQKYLKLAQGDDVKNNLLGIIAVPFFTHKKQKQPLLDRLVDKISINIDKESTKDAVKDTENR